MSTEAAPDKSIRRKLGRGLGSLLSTPVQVDLSGKSPLSRAEAIVAVPEPPPVLATVQADPDALTVSMIPLGKIHPNPRQPRQHFDEEAMRSLANSIRASGVMQPIIVRLAPGSTAGEFQLIAGERRWRAAQLAGLERIPAVVRLLDDRTTAEFALVENLQREDLNPIERAEAFARLLAEFGMTHQEIADQVGLDRTSITNHLRLNELDDFTKDAVRAGRLSIGHAKALLAITNIVTRAAVAVQAVRQGWSVRQTEARARQPQAHAETVPSLELHKKLNASPHISKLQKTLSERLGTKVHLQPGRTKGGGKMIIEFYTLDQFEGLLRLLGVETE
jgi:ParB family transcriptional regulator, chromosome partitioning protein